MCDEKCKNPNCEYYPYYGIAPHIHKGDSMIGSTVILDKKEWPENFIEDPDCEGCGTYVCPDCHSGR